MAKLIYSQLTSLDGYVNDSAGNFDWAVPSAEVHAFVNDMERAIGTSLYGRRLYETLRVWETWDTRDEPAEVSDYQAIWKHTDKLVFSTTLETVSSGRTSIRRTFDVDDIRAMKADSERDISVGGPSLAAAAIRAGLVDEYRLFLNPVAVGGGTPFFPVGVHLDLKLIEQRRFENGTVYLRYLVAWPART